MLADFVSWSVEAVSFFNLTVLVLNKQSWFRFCLYFLCNSVGLPQVAHRASGGAAEAVTGLTAKRSVG